jgi:hypothetical protein
MKEVGVRVLIEWLFKLCPFLVPLGLLQKSSLPSKAHRWRARDCGEQPSIDLHRKSATTHAGNSQTRPVPWSSQECADSALRPQ